MAAGARRLTPGVRQAPELPPIQGFPGPSGKRAPVARPSPPPRVFCGAEFSIPLPHDGRAWTPGPYRSMFPAVTPDLASALAGATRQLRHLVATS